jgi:hypothetical protein
MCAIRGEQESVAAEQERGICATEVSFEAALWELVAGEAAAQGVSVSEYVRDAAVARAAFALRARGDGPDELLADWARRAIVGQARERQEEASALRGESRQARRQAKAARSANVILEAAAALVTRALERDGFALAAPVMARFLDRQLDTGIEIEVSLKDRRRADAARAALAERFGDRSRLDVIHVS